MDWKGGGSRNQLCSAGIWEWPHQDHKIHLAGATWSSRHFQILGIGWVSPAQLFYWENWKFKQPGCRERREWPRSDPLKRKGFFFYPPAATSWWRFSSPAIPRNYRGNNSFSSPQTELHKANPSGSGDVEQDEQVRAGFCWAFGFQVSLPRR